MLLALTESLFHRVEASTTFASNLRGKRVTVIVGDEAWRSRRSRLLTASGKEVFISGGA